MNNRNDKLNYIKNLIREEVKSEFKKRARFLYEQEVDEVKSQVKFIPSDNGGSLFITNLSKYKTLNLINFKLFEGTMTPTHKNVFNLELIINLSDPSIILSMKDFDIMPEEATGTLSIKFLNKSATGFINVIYPRTMKLNHDINPASKSRYGF